MEDYYIEAYLDSMLPPKLKSMTEECRHKYVSKNDDGWYICGMCYEELMYNPNKRPVSLYDLIVTARKQQRIDSRIKNLKKWLRNYNIPFEEHILIEFSRFIYKHEELFPDRKNLISKDYILFQMLRKRGCDGIVKLRLPKMKKTLDQNEVICRTIFEALN